MSELPMAPTLDQNSAQEKNTPEYHYTSSEFARDLNVLKNEPSNEAQFDLEADEPLDPTIWSGKTTHVEAPVEAIAPKSRAQEIEETLFYRTPAEQVAYGYNITQAVIAYRRAA